MDTPPGHVGDRVPSLSPASLPTAGLAPALALPSTPFWGSIAPFFFFPLYLFTQPFVSWFLKYFFYLKPPGFVPGNDVNKRAPFWGRNLGFDVSLVFILIFFPYFLHGVKAGPGGDSAMWSQGGHDPMSPGEVPGPLSSPTGTRPGGGLGGMVTPMGVSKGAGTQQGGPILLSKP